MPIFSQFLVALTIIAIVGGIIFAVHVSVKANSEYFKSLEKDNTKQKAQIFAKMKQGNFCKHESKIAKLHFFLPLTAAHEAPHDLLS